jgi:nucleoside phosphorylase
MESCDISTQPASITPNILLVTVTKVEARAIRKVFSKAVGKDWIRKTVKDKTYYDLGSHGNVQVFMVQSEMGIATPGGALLTVDHAIDRLKPQAVIMCGIAFGLRPNKQKIGDILISKQLEYYEPQKIDSQNGQIPRGDRVTASERLLDRFQSADHDWNGSQTHFGLVLSGEKLVNEPTFLKRLLEIEPEAIGGEMEGAGLYAAARNTKVDWILAKAICDWADGNKSDKNQAKAAKNAASFVLHVLQLGGWGCGESGLLTDLVDGKDEIISDAPIISKTTIRQPSTKSKLSDSENSGSDVNNRVEAEQNAGDQTIQIVQANNVYINQQTGRQESQPGTTAAANNNQSGSGQNIDTTTTRKPNHSGEKVFKIPFTNREDERKAILLDTTWPHYLLDAPAGYGKTELMHNLKDAFLKDGYCVAYVSVKEITSLQQCVKTICTELSLVPDDLKVSEDADSLILGYAFGDQFAEHLRSGCIENPQGLVLFIDDLDARHPEITQGILNGFLPALDDQLRAIKINGVSYFADPENHHRFRIILAGRYITNFIDHISAPIRSRSLHLQPFDHDVVHKTAQKAFPDFVRQRLSEVAAHTLYLTAGHPGCMAEMLRVYDANHRIEPELFVEHYAEAIWEHIVKGEFEKIIHEIPAHFQKSFQALSFYRCFNTHIVEELMRQGEIQQNDVHDFLDGLKETFLLEKLPYFYRDDVTRRLVFINERYQSQKSPDLFIKNCQRAEQMYLKDLENPSLRVRPQWATECFYQYLQTHAFSAQTQRERKKIRSELFEMALPKVMGVYLNDPFQREGDCDALIKVMDDDWEFKFMMNYYLRGREFSESPFIDFREKIEEWKAQVGQ